MSAILPRNLRLVRSSGTGTSVARPRLSSYVRYSAFVWDPTRETWDDFPVPPVMGSVSQMDGHTVVCGRCRSDQPTEQPESRLLGDMRLFVLDAGSRDWVEWDIPDSLPAGVGHPSTRYTAVRIG